MKISVAPISIDVVAVTTSPSLWRRLFFRARTEHRYAIRTRYGRWMFEHERGPIRDGRIERELDKARLDALRVSRASSGIEPPS